MAVHVADVVRALKHMYTINAITINNGISVYLVMVYSFFNLCFLGLQWDNITTMSVQYKHLIVLTETCKKKIIQHKQ